MTTNREATIVVDYQNWFADKKTNELYVQWGETIAPIINQLMRETKSKGWIVIATKDMHRIWNISFANNFIWKKPITEVWPNDSRAFITLEEVINWTEERNWLNPSAWFTVAELKAYLETCWWSAIMWPNHCVVNTEWNEYHKNLDTNLIDIEVYKWYENNEHPYSWFPWIEIWTKRNLAEILEKEKIKLVKVVWLASDYCVKDTALDLAKTWKYLVELMKNATKSVSPETEVIALEQMREAGVKVID